MRRTVTLRGLWAKQDPLVRLGVAEALLDRLAQLWEMQLQANAEGNTTELAWVVSQYKFLRDDHVYSVKVKQVQPRPGMRRLLRDKIPEVALMAAYLQRVLNKRYRIKRALRKYEAVLKKRIKKARRVRDRAGLYEFNNSGRSGHCLHAGIQA